MKRIWIACVLSVIAFCGPALAEPKETDLWLRASVSIDAQGRVSGLDWNNTQAPVYALIAERVAPAVKAWEFVPATADGRPVATRTGLLIRVFASAQPDGSMKLRFDSAQTGPMAISLAPPRYPTSAAKANLSALVTALVQVTADGKPVIGELTVVTRGHRGAFDRASRDAIATWTFQPEIIDGRAVSSKIRIPIQYCIGSGSCKEFESETKRSADAPDDTYVAADTAVALKTDIRAQVI